MKKVISVCSVLMVLLIVSALCLAGCSSEYKLPIDDNLKPNFIDDNYRTYYEIFVGAFSDSNNDGMGDLQGIINRLDYLNDGDPNSGKSLKITGIWLMPIMPSPSYHKYDVSDYMAIDEQYGTMDTMRQLVDECHKRGINIIIDLVLNHTSTYHKWFTEAKKARSEGDVNNQYYDYYTVSTEYDDDWYYFATDPDGTRWYYEGNFSSEMPELNFDNPKVKEEVSNIVKFWLTDVNVDGFRLDAVIYFYNGDTDKNIELLDWLNKTCKSYKPDAYLIGENYSADSSSIIEYYQSVNCFDFGFSELDGDVVGAVKVGGNSWFAGSVESYYNKVKQSNPDAIMAPFLSNHDMDRSAGYLYADDKTMQMAANLYLLMPGNPYIYYGEEIGMKGSRGNENTDANRRLAMLWGDGDTVQNPVGSTYPADRQTNGTVASQLKDKQSIYNHYKKVIALRNANPEIARGDVTAVYSLGQDVAVLRYEYNGSVVYVVHNISATPITLDVSPLNVTTLRGWATSECKLSGNNLQMSAYSSVVLK